MAGAGQGDLLAGVLGARLGAGLPPANAAAHAAWICGRAAEITLAAGGQSEESLTAMDVASAIGSAFIDWRTANR
jgi:NAD(P)H-hydrate epimerase